MNICSISPKKTLSGDDNDKETDEDYNDYNHHNHHNNCDSHDKCEDKATDRDESDDTTTNRKFPTKTVKASKLVNNRSNFVSDEFNDQRYTFGSSLGRGTYAKISRVIDTTDKNDKKRYAMKKFINDEKTEGIRPTTLREISSLKCCNHPNVVNVIGCFVNRFSNICLIMPCYTYDLNVYIKKMADNPAWNLDCKKTIVFKLLQGLRYIHSTGFIHRDLKPHNVLIETNDDNPNNVSVAIADFGLTRRYYCTSLPTKQTNEVETLWYRAPEILFGKNSYNSLVDNWSLGCIIAEMLTGETLFPGDSKIDQIYSIFRLFGTPPKDSELASLPNFPKFSPMWKSQFKNKFKDFDPDAIELLEGLLQMYPSDRWCCRVALESDFMNGVCSDLRNSYKTMKKSHFQYENTGEGHCSGCTGEYIEWLSVHDVATPINLKNQNGITPHMLYIVYDWLIVVMDEYKLTHATYFRAVKVCSDMISKSRTKITKEQLQCLGIAAMSLASKIEEVYPPSVEEYSYITDRTYTPEEIVKMEQTICSELQYNFYGCPTISDTLVVQLENAKYTKEEKAMVDLILFYGSLNVKMFTKYRAATLTAVAISIVLDNTQSNHNNTDPNFDKKVVFGKKKDFAECMKEYLQWLEKDPKKSKLTSVYEVFATRKYHDAYNLLYWNGKFYRGDRIDPENNH